MSASAIINSVCEAAALDYDLKAKYDYFNQKLFTGKLPEIPLRWSSDRRVGGKVTYMSARSIIESEWDDEWQDDELPPLPTTSLPAGTVLYHGTQAKERFERDGQLSFPAWFTRSISVARHFSKRREGKARILKYKLTEPVDNIVVLTDQRDFDRLTDGEPDVYEMPYVLSRLGYSGWLIADNYPDGDDILLCDLPAWEFLGVTK